MGNEKLMEAYGALRLKLHRTAFRMLRDDDDAKDAMQDAFCNLWEAGTYETDAEARGKLVTTLRNVCLNMLRKRRPNSELTEELCVSDEAAHNFGIDEAMVAERLLEQLTPLQREIMRLRMEGGYEYEAIAGRLDMKVEAVRVNVSRARKKMYEIYKTVYEQR